jgi:hypothetical protein
MKLHRKLCQLAVFCVALVALQPSLARAQGPQPDKYFPEGTDMVISINLNQMMGSNLLKKGIPLLVQKYGEKAINMVSNFVPDENQRKMMEQIAPELKNMVTEESVDTFMKMGKEQVREFTIAMNTKEEVGNIPNMVMTFGAPMLTSAMVEQFAPMMTATGQLELKEEKVGDVTVYEMKQQQQPMPFYIAIPEDGLMVMSISKEVMAKAIKSKGKTNVAADFKPLWAQRKNSYSIFAAGLAPKNKEDEIKNFVAHLTLDKDVNGAVEVLCTSEEKAKEHAKEASESFESAVESIVNFANDHPELKPLADSLKKVKAEVSGNKINMKLNINGDAVIKAMKDAK